MRAVPVEQLWERFAKTGSLRDRNAVIEHFYPFTVELSQSWARSRGVPKYTHEDLTGCALVALCECVDRFDPERGVPFRSYASLRIKGAMQDWLRHIDPLPRPARKFARAVESASKIVSGQLGRHATVVEIADWMNEDVVAVEEALVDLHALHQGQDLDNVDPEGDLPVSEPDEAVDVDVLQGVVADGFDRLDARAKVVATCFYLHQMPMRDIAELLDVAESRVSQLLTDAVRQMRGDF